MYRITGAIKSWLIEEEDNKLWKAITDGLEVLSTFHSTNKVTCTFMAELYGYINQKKEEGRILVIFRAVDFSIPEPIYQKDMLTNDSHNVLNIFLAECVGLVIHNANIKKENEKNRKPDKGGLEDL